MWIRPRTLGSVPRHPKKPRRLVADGRAYLWTLRHGHRMLDSGRSADCREILTLRAVEVDGWPLLEGAAAARAGDAGPAGP